MGAFPRPVSSGATLQATDAKGLFEQARRACDPTFRSVADATG
jgi:hypothetical protein